MPLAPKARVRAVLGRNRLNSVPVVALGSGLLAALLAMVLYKLGTPQHQLKAGLALIALITVVVAALRPIFALGLVVALLPFEYHVYGVGTDEALIFGVAVVLAWRIEARRIPAWAFIAGAGLVGGSVLSVLQAHDKASALWGATRWLAVLLLLFEAFSLLYDHPEAGRRLVDIVTCSALIVVFFGLLQKAGIYAIVGPPYQAGNIQSFFSYYTNYGGYVALATVLATGELLTARVRLERVRSVAYAAAIVFLLLGLAISASRGALLSLGAGWATLLILNLRRAHLTLRVVAILALLGVAGAIATPSQTRVRIINRFSSPVGSQTEDVQRFALQNLGKHALEKKPLGIGYNNFRFYLANHPTRGANQIFYHSHDLFIQVGLDAGWVGLAGFLLMFAGALVSAIRAGPVRGLRNVACAAALAGFMAQGLFDYLFFDISLVAMFLALVWGSARKPVGAAAI